MNVIVRDQYEIEKRIKQGDFFIKEILEEEIPLYVERGLYFHIST
jgi:hypothetical protein